MASPGVVGDGVVRDLDDLAGRHILVAAGALQPLAERTKCATGLDRGIERAVQTGDELALRCV